MAVDSFVQVLSTGYRQERHSMKDYGHPVSLNQASAPQHSQFEANIYCVNAPRRLGRLFTCNDLSTQFDQKTSGSLSGTA